MRTLFLDLALITGLSISFCLGASAQQVSSSKLKTIERIAPQPTKCEFNIAILDSANSNAGSNGLVIIIARRGKNETRGDLNHRRLHNVRMYLEAFAGRKPATIAVAEGDQVDGYGQIEIYVKGKLFYIFKVGTDLDFAVGECSYEGEDPCTFKRESRLYPCLGRENR